MKKVVKIRNSRKVSDHDRHISVKRAKSSSKEEADYYLLAKNKETGKEEIISTMVSKKKINEYLKEEKKLYDKYSVKAGFWHNYSNPRLVKADRIKKGDYFSNDIPHNSKILIAEKYLRENRDKTLEEIEQIIDRDYGERSLEGAGMYDLVRRKYLSQKGVSK